MADETEATQRLSVTMSAVLIDTDGTRHDLGVVASSDDPEDAEEKS